MSAKVVHHYQSTDDYDGPAWFVHLPVWLQVLLTVLSVAVPMLWVKFALLGGFVS